MPSIVHGFVVTAISLPNYFIFQVILGLPSYFPGDSNPRLDDWCWPAFSKYDLASQISFSLWYDHLLFELILRFFIMFGHYMLKIIWWHWLIYTCNLFVSVLATFHVWQPYRSIDFTFEVFILKTIYVQKRNFWIIVKNRLVYSCWVLNLTKYAVLMKDRI